MTEVTEGVKKQLIFATVYPLISAAGLIKGSDHSQKIGYEI